jgi:hypothetical protein
MAGRSEVSRPLIKQTAEPYMPQHAAQRHEAARRDARTSGFSDSDDAGDHGFRTTLMQPSFLSRNVLYAAGASESGTRCVMICDGSMSPAWIFS